MATYVLCFAEQYGRHIGAAQDIRLYTGVEFTAQLVGD